MPQGEGAWSTVQRPEAAASARVGFPPWPLATRKCTQFPQDQSFVEVTLLSETLLGPGAHPGDFCFGGVEAEPFKTADGLCTQQAECT